jgi:oxygen-dependent protoporphyrinogen oxidase
VTRARTVVVGAGIAGLACATELVARGVDDVLVLEAAPRAGGPAETVASQGYTIERGPSTVRGNEALARLAEAAGTTLLPARRARPAIVSAGKVTELPPPLRKLVSGSFLPHRGMASLLAEPLRPVRAGPKSVRAFVEERFGATVAERFADLLTLGVHGTTADQVGFESAFPELAAAIDAAGGRVAALALRRLGGRSSAPTRPGVVSTAIGLGGLCDRLALRLGPRLRLSTPVLRARGHAGAFELELGGAAPAVLSCEQLVLTIPAPAAARVLDVGGAAPLLAAYRTVPQLVASFALDDPRCADSWQGLGFLVPPRERLPLLGCLFPSNLFPGRAPEGSLLLSAFAAPALHKAPDAELGMALARVLKHLLGADRLPSLLGVARHPQGIPLYDVAHRARTDELRARLEAARGPLLCGASYDGVAFAAAAESGLAAARQLLDATRP